MIQLLVELIEPMIVIIFIAVILFALREPRKFLGGIAEVGKFLGKVVKKLLKMD